jgi:hypothetical protein
MLPLRYRTIGDNCPDKCLRYNTKFSESDFIADGPFADVGANAWKCIPDENPTGIEG